MDANITNRIIANTKDALPFIKSFLEKIVSLESPTDNPAVQQPLLTTIAEEFLKLGYNVIQMPGNISGGYLYARPGNRIKNQPIQLLIGHCDTVWPLSTIEEMPIVSDNGKMTGPGIFDMKAGLTQIIFALKTIKELDLKLTYTPVVLINSDEEKGSRESTDIIKRLSRIAARAYVLEPPLGLDGKLKTARKGLGRFTLTVVGKSAHAGLEPGKGASAILELSHQIQELFKLNDHEKGITVNVGMIEGGMNPNVIAPMAKAIVDVRVLTHKDGERIAQQIKSLKAFNPETELIVEGYIGRPPMEKTKRNQEIWRSAQKIGVQMGLQLKEATAGGGSDGNTTSLFTATLDGLGTTGDGAHARHEHILTDKLVERTALLTHLLAMD
ncbi:MAG: M20 family metallopeptidase [Bacteroidia bacterium]|nr:M20 family metallopeptidase [Bacteroidia bacterium]